jgi:hypothetical protein
MLAEQKARRRKDDKTNGPKSQETSDAALSKNDFYRRPGSRVSFVNQVKKSNIIQEETTTSSTLLSQPISSMSKLPSTNIKHGSLNNQITNTDSETRSKKLEENLNLIELVTQTNTNLRKISNDLNDENIEMTLDENNQTKSNIFSSTLKKITYMLKFASTTAGFPNKDENDQVHTESDLYSITSSESEKSAIIRVPSPHRTRSLVLLDRSMATNSKRSLSNDNSLSQKIPKEKQPLNSKTLGRKDALVSLAKKSGSAQTISLTETENSI